MRILFTYANRHLIGTTTYTRLPRKLKKRQNKTGTFKHREFTGFDVDKLFDYNGDTF